MKIANWLKRALFLDWVLDDDFPASTLPFSEATDEEVARSIRSIPAHYVGMSSLTGSSLQSVIKWTAQNNLVGSTYSPTGNGGQISKTYSLGTANANNASGGCDEFFSFQQAIAGAGSATIDLNALTNILQQASVAIVRIKGYQIRLLDTNDDPTITAPVSTGITVTNIGPAVPSPLDFSSGGSGLTVALTQAAGAVTAVAIGVAGSGYPPSTTFLASPQQTGGSGNVFAVTTNASGVPTAVVFITGAGGAGYSNATVPAVAVGQYTIFNSGAHLYFDVSPAGFCAVSTTSRNIKIINNHAINTATVEITLFGATS